MKQVLTLLLLLPSLANAWSLHSQTVAHHQQKYADRFPDHPILIVDFDEIGWLYARAKAYGEGESFRQRRLKVLQTYFAEKIAVELDNAELSILEHTIDISSSTGGYAQPLPTEHDPLKFKLCLVVPASPNYSQRQAVEHRLQMDNAPEAYPDLDYGGLAHKPSLEIMQLFTTLHELGHCMDRHYLPERQMYAAFTAGFIGVNSIAHMMHLSEAYAESVALMLLRDEGKDEEGETLRALAHMRNTYTWKFGHWLAHNPPPGIDGSLNALAGMVYHLAPVMLGMEKLFDFNTDDTPLSVDNLEHILSSAKKMVEEHALTMMGMNMLIHYLQHGREATEAHYRELLLEQYSYHAKGYAQFLSFLDFAPAFYAQGILADAPPLDNSGRELPPITDVQLCSAKTRRELSVKLDHWRQELRLSGVSHASSLRRKKELDGIHQRYSMCQQLPLDETI